MKEALNQWLSEHSPVTGVQAVGLHHADDSFFTQVSDPGFSREGVDHAWRCVADTFRVLKHHRCPAANLRWSFELSLLFCLQRPEGACLMVFTTSKPQELDAASLQALFAEFQGFAAQP